MWFDNPRQLIDDNVQSYAFESVDGLPESVLLTSKYFDVEASAAGGGGAVDAGTCIKILLISEWINKSKNSKKQLKTQSTSDGREVSIISAWLLLNSSAELSATCSWTRIKVLLLGSKETKDVRLLADERRNEHLPSNPEPDAN